MKSKLFLTVLLLTAITTIGISQEKEFQPLRTNEDLRAERAKIYEMPEKIRNLVSIKDMHIFVVNLNEDAESTGLTKEQLKMSVELKLRLVGIKVNSEEEWFASSHSACIYVQITSVGLNNIPSSVYDVSINFKQDVTLVRSPYSTVNATTWERSLVGFCPQNDFQKIVQDTVKDLMDDFINDYLTANPKNDRFYISKQYGQ